MARRWQVLLIVSTGVFMASLDLFVVNFALPSIGRDFAGTSLTDLSWVLSGYSIVFASLLVPAGRWGDRLGRKRLFLAGLVLFVLASAACAAAPSAGPLVAARVLQAAGGALMIPTSLGLLLAEFPPSERARAVGAWAGIGGIAAACGPPLGGLLVEVSWRWIFLVNLPVGIACLGAALRILRESGEPVRGPRPDLVGAFALASGSAALVLAIVKGPDWGWSSAATLASFALAALLVAAFLRRSARHPAPVVELELLRVRVFAVASAGALLFFAAFGAMLLSHALFLTTLWGHSVLRAGLELAPGPSMAAVSATLAGRLVERVGPRAVAVPGLLLFALGCVLWVGQVGNEPHYAATLLPGMLLTGTGVGLTLALLTAAAVSSLPPARFATGTGVFGMSRQIGAALGVAILVAIVGSPSTATLASFRHAWVYMAATAVAAGLLAIGIGRPAPAESAIGAPVPESA